MSMGELTDHITCFKNKNQCNLFRLHRMLLVKAEESDIHMISLANADDSFMQVYQKYRNTVFGIAFSYTKSSADSCDIVQDVFIKYITSKNTFNSDEHIKAWLIRVTVNECKKHLMSSWVSRTVSLEDQTIPYEFDQEDLELFEAVMSMSLKYRIPIHLHYYEGYSVSEIASFLGARESTVKVRLLRARKMLKLRLEEVFEDGHKGPIQENIQQIL